jgi:hypothetical protein
MVRRQADDDHDRKLLDDVERRGWHLVGIGDDPEVPAYVFSVGMFHTLGQPEICIFGLGNLSTMGTIVNVVGELMRSGRRFEDRQESDEVLDGYTCAFRRVNPSLYREYFGYCRWFYEGDDFPMLQCIWPDKANRFPWDSQFDSRVIPTQPVLAEKSAWPFLDAKDCAVFTTHRVLDEGDPILCVVHDEDGDWQFLGSDANDSGDARVVSLQDIVENHPSVIELADLPTGWRAIRGGPGESWRRIQS